MDKKRQEETQKAFEYLLVDCKGRVKNYQTDGTMDSYKEKIRKHLKSPCLKGTCWCIKVKNNPIEEQEIYVKLEALSMCFRQVWLDLPQVQQPLCRRAIQHVVKSYLQDEKIDGIRSY